MRTTNIKDLSGRDLMFGRFIREYKQEDSGMCILFNRGGFAVSVSHINACSMVLEQSVFLYTVTE